jgi:hypothetical protein
VIMNEVLTDELKDESIRQSISQTALMENVYARITVPQEDFPCNVLTSHKAAVTIYEWVYSWAIFDISENNEIKLG